MSRLLILLLIPFCTRAFPAPLYLGKHAVAFKPSPSLSGAIPAAALVAVEGHRPEKPAFYKAGAGTPGKVPEASINSVYSLHPPLEVELNAKRSAVVRPEWAVAKPAVSRQAQAIRIMPLGDSNTEGTNSNEPPLADRIAYRQKLEQLLDGSKFKGLYDFVGSERTGSAHMNDTDHAGFGGARDEDIATLLKEGEFDFYNTGEYRGPGGGPYLDKYKPDIILLHIGTNWIDPKPEAVQDVANILDLVDAYEKRAKKEVTVILAKIILSDGRNPAVDADIKAYNNNVRAMAEKRVQAGDRIEFVDMQEGAGLIYKNTAAGGDMHDQLHPNQKGYEKMAAVWFKALEKVINLDTEAPAAPVVKAPANGSVTNNPKPALSGTAEAGSTVTVTVDNTVLGSVTAAANGNWTITPSSALANGAHTVTAEATDAAGNTGPASSTVTFTVDTKAPAAPVVSAPAEGAVLNNPKPTVAGTAEAGSRVTLYIGTATVGAVTAEANGQWSFVPGTALADGAHQLTARATDAAGNSGPASTIRNFSLDTRAPETTIASGPDAITKSSDATFSFKSNEFGVIFQVSLDGGAYTAVSSPYTVSGLGDGTHTVAVRARDAAGNTDASPATYTWLVDTKAPEAPVFTGISEDRGPRNDDQVTADNTIKLIGKAEASAAVEVIYKGAVIGSTKADASGNWVFSYESTALAAGTHIFIATATDAAGNTSATSINFSITIEQTAPTVTLLAEGKAAVKEAFTINIRFSEEVYGVAAADFEVTNGNVSNLTSSDKINFTALVTPAVDGAVQVKFPAAKATDLAGNPNGASNLLERRYDATPPNVTLQSEAPSAVNAPFVVRFAFDEAVSGFDEGDITLINATVRDFTVLNAMTYTATIAPEGEGVVRVSIAAGNALDEAGNGNQASSTLKRLHDTKRPAVALETQASNPTNAPFTVTVRFSEAVTGFAADDIVLANAKASQLKQLEDRVYSVLITPGENGEVSVNLPANAVQDAATNGNQPANTLRLLYDAERPSVAISTDAPALTNEAFAVTFRTSEAVTGFDLPDIKLANAAARDLKKVSELEYMALIRPTRDGQVQVSIPENMLYDAATNGNTASNLLQITYDATAPQGYAIQFAVDKVDAINQKQVSLAINGAETGALYTFAISSSNGGEPVTRTATASAAAFTVSGLDLSGLKDGELTVSLYMVDQVGNKGAEVTDRVEKLTKDIVAVSDIPEISVPFKTSFAAVPLPKEVEVTYTNGEREKLRVTWDKGSYNGNVPERYMLTGTLALKENTSNTGNKTAQLTVKVEPNRPPTALSLSQTTFRPDIDPSEAIGFFTTSDPDDNAFVYVLVAGQGDADNSLFEINNDDELLLRSNKGLSGKSIFTIRVRSTDPYQNTIEEIFTLTKSLYQPQDKIKLVNAFSPDGDGVNDTWKVPELRYYNQVEVEVYDRAGVRLFHSSDPEEGWDGKGADGRVLQGAFFYIIQVKDIGLVQKGVVTVLK